MLIHPTDTVYISGPMTGRPAFNIPLFIRVEKRLRWRYGCGVLNPGTLGAGQSWQWYMREDVKMLSRASVLLQLPGWDTSRGARIEADIAAMHGIRAVCARAAGVVLC